MMLPRYNCHVTLNFVQSTTTTIRSVTNDPSTGSSFGRELEIDNNLQSDVLLRLTNYSNLIAASPVNIKQLLCAWHWLSKIRFNRL